MQKEINILAKNITDQCPKVSKWSINLFVFYLVLFVVVSRAASLVNNHEHPINNSDTPDTLTYDNVVYVTSQDNLACFFHLLISLKVNYFKNIFQEYQQRVSQFGSR